MLYHNVRVMAHYMRSLDALGLGLTAAGVWAVGLRYGRWEAAPTERAALLFSSVLVVAFWWLAGRFHVYHARRTEHITRELSALFEVMVYATGLGCIGVEVLTPGLPGTVYAATLGAAAVLGLGSRVALRAFIRRVRRAGGDYRVWLLVGRNARSARLAEGVLTNPHFGIRVDQIVDFPGGSGSQDARLDRFAHPPLSEIPQREIADAEAVRELLGKSIVDEVVVTLPLRSHYDAIARILAVCGEAGISVKLSTDNFEPADTRAELSHVGSIPMVTHFSGPADPSPLMVKRLIDVVGAGAALVFLSPFLAGLALLTKLGSRGPVFYVQTRVGLHGRLFRMVKFRTMVQDADQLRQRVEPLNETDGAAFKIRNDPRVVPVGRFLRKYHFDELPQLWNVLVGDMSLVGPRPLPPGEATGEVWWQRRRLSMPPGLTCLWQAEGDHTIPFGEWMQLDLAYIDQWSLWLDLRVLCRTILMLPRGLGW